jgi:hypothetical protein
MAHDQQINSAQAAWELIYCNGDATVSRLGLMISTHPRVEETTLAKIHQINFLVCQLHLLPVQCIETHVLLRGALLMGVQH